MFVVGGSGGGDPECDLDRVVHFEIVGAFNVEAGDVFLGSIVGEDVVPSGAGIGVVAEAGGLVGLCPPGGGLVPEVVPHVCVEAGLKCVEAGSVCVEVCGYKCRAVWVRFEFEAGVGEQVIRLLGDSFVAGLAAACKSIHGQDVKHVPWCEYKAVEVSSSLLDPFGKGRCLGGYGEELQWFVHDGSDSGLGLGRACVEWAEVELGRWCGRSVAGRCLV